MVTGPYTTSDSISYEPLRDLVQYLQTQPPDVCIMVCIYIHIIKISRGWNLQPPKTRASIISIFKFQLYFNLNSIIITRARLVPNNLASTKTGENFFVLENSKTRLPLNWNTELHIYLLFWSLVYRCNFSFFQMGPFLDIKNAGLEVRMLQIHFHEKKIIQ